ncbi:glucokinase [Chthonomonas calidirosea]|uniref:Glucokinase n=1 Tax=Chthonomonas calidirosea (strain DSM 23976 / ICMP 18418 / T49) TaxID=1303518 RepID=S0EY34_CHTCT|nr:ROK family protein [Chthonomonas calidirosea]CCW36624.1 glucokinase [Chthonomonas calidirosea T49]CEK15673.1 glucokinase [Chthonomonas calidirosea]CEK15675.1 glucokinase [Chthonomonas calidirosea]CEK16774.1 glucokinase [Chthonomonas calidirosea]
MSRIQPRKEAPYVVGVDLGGTNVRAAVIDRNEKLLGRAENSSEAKGGVARTVAAIATAVRNAVKAANVSIDEIGAIGVAVPGHIDVPAGMVRWAPNFGDYVDGTYVPYKDVPLRELVEKELGIAMVMDNDANVAALGEFRYGAGRGTRHLVMFTLGTGIGGGIIVDGQVLRGATGGAAEVGHIIIADGKGSSPNGPHGRLEVLAGRDGIVERAALKMESGRDTLLWRHITGPEALQQFLTPKLIDQAAEEGDALAREVLEEIGHFVGLGIASMVNVFNPEVVVLGGKISNSRTLFDAAVRTARASAIGSILAAARIVRAELGDDAGIMGASELAWREMA